MIRRKSDGARRGAAAVELAFILPLLALLLLGVWEVGRIAQVEQTLANAAREAARRGASGGRLLGSSYSNLNDEMIESAVRYMQQAGYTTTNVRVKIQNLVSGASATYGATHSLVAGSTFDLASANQLDSLRVTVSIPFTDVQWAALTRITAVPQTTLSGQTQWYCLKDKDFPSLSDPPIE